MKNLTDREKSDAKRLIYALTTIVNDENRIRVLVRVLNYCDAEQLIRDINALDKVRDNVKW